MILRCGLERLINCRRGVTRKDDVLPWRVMHEPIPNGVPTPEKLAELGLA